MKSAATYIDEIKIRHNLPSDYAAGKLLGVTRQTISRYRNGLDHFGPEICETVAELLGVDVEDVLLDSTLSRARTDGERRAWQRVIDRLGSAVSTAPAAAPTSGLCIMSSCKRLIYQAKQATISEIQALSSFIRALLFPARTYA